jgi:hypothetical protein
MRLNRVRPDDRRRDEVRRAAAPKANASLRTEAIVHA